MDEHVDGHYVVLRFVAQCPVRPVQLAVHYSLLFDADPTHRGSLLQITAGPLSQAAVLPRESPSVAIDLDSPQRWRQFTEFVTEGVWHIWKGFDHILFLLTLLFPAVIVYQAGRWEARGSWKASAVDVLKVVTAFTAAHSLTLSLAVLDLIHAPSRLVESAIAATVLLGALNNLFPVVLERRWLVAFVFGLVHGLGFASVLSDLGLSGANLALALVGFNGGVNWPVRDRHAVLAGGSTRARHSVLPEGFCTGRLGNHWRGCRALVDQPFHGIYRVGVFGPGTRQRRARGTSIGVRDARPQGTRGAL